MRLQPGEWMMDVDRLLSVINNPTRRRIMEALVREPHYPLQLARELRVSQPAIIKHLNTLEESGLVSSYSESSNRGPERKQYVTTSEFTLVVDLRDGMFTARLMSPGPKDDKRNRKERKIKDIMEARAQVGVIDDELEELERRRSEIINRRRGLIAAANSLLDVNEQHYRARALLYEIMNNPRLTMEEIAKRLSMNAEECADMLDEMVERTVEEYRHSVESREVNQDGK